MLNPLVNDHQSDRVGTSLSDHFKGRLQLNFEGVGVELRMKERRIEKGMHVNQLVR